MKHFYALVAALMIGIASFAQLPDGSIAPDFTATDINGVEHNLYDLLAEGKKVIVDLLAYTEAADEFLVRFLFWIL